MKYLFASDIHGSSEFCRRMLDAFAAEEADKMIFLGDILYHGPRNALPSRYLPQGVIEALNSRKEDILICMKGNCDAEVDEMVLDFPLCPGFKKIELNGRNFFLTHGHIYNAESFGMRLPKGMGTGDILVHGHTHIPLAQIREAGTKKIFLLNPGSTSIPKGGYSNSYGVLGDDMIFYVRDFNGMVIKSVDLNTRL